MLYHLENDHVELHANVMEQTVYLTGSIKRPSNYNEKYIMAPNPIDRMLNYSGSGLPFPCPSIAFENTPNYYEIPKDGEIQAIFTYPNSYYTMETQEKIIPSIFITLKRNGATPLYYQMQLEDTLPLRTSTTYRPAFKKGPEFYAKKEEIMGIPPSQEWILRNIGDYKAKYEMA